MSGDDNDQEPSMEDILASIKRILSDDEADEAASRTDGQPGYELPEPEPETPAPDEGPDNGFDLYAAVTSEKAPETLTPENGDSDLSAKEVANLADIGPILQETADDVKYGPTGPTSETPEFDDLFDIPAYLRRQAAEKSEGKAPGTPTPERELPTFLAKPVKTGKTSLFQRITRWGLAEEADQPTAEPTTVLGPEDNLDVPAYIRRAEAAEARKEARAMTYSAREIGAVLKRASPGDAPFSGAYHEALADKPPAKPRFLGMRGQEVKDRYEAENSPHLARQTGRDLKTESYRVGIHDKVSDTNDVNKIGYISAGLARVADIVAESIHFNMMDGVDSPVTHAYTSLAWQTGSGISAGAISNKENGLPDLSQFVDVEDLIDSDYTFSDSSIEGLHPNANGYRKSVDMDDTSADGYDPKLMQEWEDMMNTPWDSQMETPIEDGSGPTYSKREVPDVPLDGIVITPPDKEDTHPLRDVPDGAIEDMLRLTMGEDGYKEFVAGIRSTAIHTLLEKGIDPIGSSYEINPEDYDLDGLEAGKLARQVGNRLAYDGFSFGLNTQDLSERFANVETDFLQSLFDQELPYRQWAEEGAGLPGASTLSDEGIQGILEFAFDPKDYQRMVNAIQTYAANHGMENGQLRISDISDAYVEGSLGTETSPKELTIADPALLGDGGDQLVDDEIIELTEDMILPGNPFMPRSTQTTARYQTNAEGIANALKEPVKGDDYTSVNIRPADGVDLIEEIVSSGPEDNDYAFTPITPEMQSGTYGASQPSSEGAETTADKAKGKVTRFVNYAGGKIAEGKRKTVLIETHPAFGNHDYRTSAATYRQLAQAVGALDPGFKHDEDKIGTMAEVLNMVASGKTPGTARSDREIYIATVADLVGRQPGVTLSQKVDSLSGRFATPGLINPGLEAAEKVQGLYAAMNIKDRAA